MLAVLALLAALQAPAALDAYDLVFLTPSEDAAGSVPLGADGLGLNAWVEPNGDLVLLIARNDSFSEASRLLKIGRVRLRMDPPLRTGAGFSSRLALREGAWIVRAEGVEVVVFVEADRPVVRILGRTEAPTRVAAATEIWRDAPRRLRGQELQSSWTMRDAPDAVEVTESADVLADVPGALAWYHRNASSVVPFTLRHQGMEEFSDLVGDPLLHRTFGGVMAGLDFFSHPTGALVSEEAFRSFDLALAVPPAAVLDEDGLSEWLRDAAAMVQHPRPAAEARAAARARWEEFWSRSWIFVRGDPSPFGLPRHAGGPPRLGRDSSGANLWQGEFAGARIRAGGAQAPGAEPPTGAEAAPRLDPPPPSAAFTIETWLRREPSGASARIVDWLTAGGSDGFLFDVHPGRDLRLIVGPHTLSAPGAWPDDGAWHHVAATYDPADGAMAIWRDGARVAWAPGRADAPPSRLSQAWLLQRWVAACASGGAYPIKFNGSIFTVEPRAANGSDLNPDWRRWGDCFWWQNTRLPYYPMLAAGDWQEMRPLFRFHADVLPQCRARAQAYYGAEGAYFPETITPFGAYSNGDYGWERAGAARNEVHCPWWQWAWNQSLELLALMLDHWDYTGDAEFGRAELAPMARAALQYFDARFARDAAGRLQITPTQALETHWHGVVNDLPCVAGLHEVLPRLRALPEAWFDADDRALFARLESALPPLPVRTVDGVSLFAPAEKYDPSRQNVETPELYATFPFRLAALGSAPELLQRARATYARRHDRQTQGWTQDGVLAARLGLREEAVTNLLAKLGNSHPAYRFPATWGPNFDWLPDQCHGSNLMLLAQEMLLQTAGERILLFPAWPREWDVNFRLHAPRGTVIEAELRAGKLMRLEVTPSARTADVTVMLE